MSKLEKRKAQRLSELEELGTTDEEQTWIKDMLSSRKAYWPEYTKSVAGANMQEFEEYYVPFRKQFPKASPSSFKDYKEETISIAQRNNALMKQVGISKDDYARIFDSYNSAVTARRKSNANTSRDLKQTMRDTDNYALMLKALTGHRDETLKLKYGTLMRVLTEKMVPSAVAVSSQQEARNSAWMERNSKKVEEMILDSVTTRALEMAKYNDERRDGQKWAEKKFRPNKAHLDSWERDYRTVKPERKEGLRPDADTPIWVAGTKFTELQMRMLWLTRNEMEQMNTFDEPFELRPSEDPPLFNVPFARSLLRDHIESLNEMFVDQTNKSEGVEPKANPGKALGDDIDAAIEVAMPMFQSLMEYNRVMHWVKRIELEYQLAEGLAKDPGEEASFRKSIAELLRLTDPFPAFKRMAEHFKDTESGQLPGMLCKDQPYFMPGWLFQRCRVGKTQAAFFQMTLMWRADMVVVYSVAPNKKIPMDDLEKKLTQLGYVEHERANKKSGIDKVNKQLHVKTVPVTRVRDKARPGLDIDLLLMSKHVINDILQLLAMLSYYRYHGKKNCAVVDDEAHMGIFQEFNEAVGAGHRRHVPPSQMQALWRDVATHHPYRVIVTATPLATLLEPLYGFVGTTEQMVQTWPRMEAARWRDLEAMKAKLLGLKFLPPCPIPLIPPPPPSYIGSRYMQQSQSTIAAGAHSVSTTTQKEVSDRIEKLLSNAKQASEGVTSKGALELKAAEGAAARRRAAASRATSRRRGMSRSSSAGGGAVDAGGADAADADSADAGAADADDALGGGASGDDADNGPACRAYDGNDSD